MAGNETSTELSVTAMNNSIIAAATAANSNATNQLNASTSAASEQLESTHTVKVFLGKEFVNWIQLKE